MSKDLHSVFYGNTRGPIVHKWAHYIPIYERYLGSFRGKPITMLEIGVNYGGSLHMWREYLGPQGRYIGVDISNYCKRLEADGFVIEIGDQGSQAFWDRFKEQHPVLDIIIDDGSHVPEHQILTFETLFPHLNEGGIYICEDVHTSYKHYFGGGFRKPSTFMEYAKGLTDEINAWWSEEPSQFFPTQLTRTCVGIHFYDSVVVFEKARRQEPYDVVMGDISHASSDGGPLQVKEVGGLRSFYRPMIEEKDMPPPSAYPRIGSSVNARIEAGLGSWEAGQLRSQVDDLNRRLSELEALVRNDSS